MVITLRVGTSWSPETWRRFLRRVADDIYLVDATDDAELMHEARRALHDATVTRDDEHEKGGA